jgi:hypothetical protein
VLLHAGWAGHFVGQTTVSYNTQLMFSGASGTMTPMGLHYDAAGTALSSAPPLSRLPTPTTGHPTPAHLKQEYMIQRPTSCLMANEIANTAVVRRLCYSVHSLISCHVTVLVLHTTNSSRHCSWYL